MSVVADERLLSPARRLYRAATVRALDREAIEAAGIPGIELMRRAGRAAFAAYRRRWPRARALAVVCGPGNNGGDGYVVAREAIAAGWPVAIFAVDAGRPAAGDAATALADLRAAGARVEAVAALDPHAFAGVVDAVFGTGLSRPVEGEGAQAIERINRVRGPRLALDVPSGLNADTGQALGRAVRADLTVTFVGLKQGLFTGDAGDHAGEVILDSLGVPEPVLARRRPDAERWTLRHLGVELGARSRRAHKGRFGRVLVIGGDHGFAGAARMAGEAAARVGAGLTSVATRASHVAAVVGARPELMARAAEAPADLRPLLEAHPVIAIGPGLGTGSWGRELLAEALRSPAPLVIDADALNLLAREPALRAALQARAGHDVVTPHPGEAARVLSISPREVEQDRFAAAARLCETLAAVALLKGAGTIVHAPSRPPALCDTGHPAMASGGMGDVLTGIVAGLMAQGLAAPAAACAGALVHGEAARRRVAAGRLERGLLAGDLLEELPRLASRL